MSYKMRLSPIFLLVVLIFFAACKKDKPKTVPEVKTSTPTDLSVVSAILHGEVIGDGNAAIIERGFVYSNLVDVPTISDNKLTATGEEGVFSALLEGLTSSTTYHVRAYAKNSVGIGYGEVVNIATENAAPVAINVSVTGTVEVGQVLTATYTYQDSDNDTENGTTFQWYLADASSGTNETAIVGATASSFTMQLAQFGKYIRVGVTPKAATGTTTGAEVKSLFRDAEPTTVTFTYNGNPVTYGVIVSPTTNRKWLDRNLGAANVASSATDFANYGDLFQWGRRADGHQLVNHSGPNDASVVNGSTSSTAPFGTSNTDQPAHSNFIIFTSALPYDWRQPQNNALWQGGDGTNNPCPAGWRIATQAEWDAEGLQNVQDAFNKIKLTLTGTRWGGDGNLYLFDNGYYWTSTIMNPDPAFPGAANFPNSFSGRVRLQADSYSVASNTRVDGYSVRCTKN